jgi:hypothetical protein
MMGLPKLALIDQRNLVTFYDDSGNMSLMIEKNLLSYRPEQILSCFVLIS